MKTPDNKKKAKKVIIIGASSGIGRQLAILFSEAGYEIGLVARREELLNELSEQLRTKCYVKKIDISVYDRSMDSMRDLLKEMEDVDMIIINSAIGGMNQHFKWNRTLDVINVNVIGFSAMLNVAYRYFRKRREGHIVGISSIAAVHGSAMSPGYNASKAFVSNILQGIRQQAISQGIPITITDIKPGFVQTDIIKGVEDTFWVASVEKASKQIFKAIMKKKEHVYITKRWRLFAWFLKLMPDYILARLK